VKRVAIVGGGLAGLSCAYSLRVRGIDTTVFDAASKTRGRHTAAFYLLAPDLFRNTFQLIDRVGLAGEIIPIPPHAGQVYKRRIYHHRVASATGLLSFKGLNIVDKALLPRMAYLLARHASHLDFHDPAKGLQFDNETVASFVKRELSQNVLNYVAGPLISTLFSYGSDETSAWLYLVLAKHMHNVRMSTVRGGMHRIAAALSRELRVVTGCEIRHVESDGGTYIVAGESFSDLVMAVPGDAVLNIAGIRGLLSDEDRQFFRGCQYQRVLSIQVATGHPLDDGCYAVSIPRVENLSASTISFHDYIDPSAVPNGEGLLTISGGGSNVTTVQLLDDLKKLYPVAPLRTESHEWNPGTPKFPPGRYREITEFQRRKRRPGLFFCGDYLVGPFIEGAITTGLHAANVIES
jgi:protoporphyrinogen/coproporphyrinogen III oxidase